MSDPQPSERSPGLGRSRAAVLLLALAAGLGVALLKPKLPVLPVEHRFFQLAPDAAVETWALKLPMDYRVMRQTSTPARPDDGVRLLPPG